MRRALGGNRRVCKRWEEIANGDKETFGNKASNTREVGHKLGAAGQRPGVFPLSGPQRFPPTLRIDTAPRARRRYGGSEGASSSRRWWFRCCSSRWG